MRWHGDPLTIVGDGMTKRTCETCQKPIATSDPAASVDQSLDGKSVNTFWCFNYWDNEDDEALAQYLYIGFKVADLHEKVAGHKLGELNTFRTILKSYEIDEDGLLHDAVQS